MDSLATVDKAVDVLLALAAAPASQGVTALGRALDHPLDRPFAGHVTLARARRRGGDKALETAQERLQGRFFGPLPARELLLFESRSGPDGVRYLVRERALLPVRD